MGCCASNGSAPLSGVVDSVRYDCSDDSNPVLPRVNSLAKERKNKEVNGTVMPYSKFLAETDANALRAAMKGIGTDEEVVIKIIANRSSEQLRKVVDKYREMYNRSLEKDLESELSGHFEHVCVGRLYPTYQYDAYTLRRAMKGIGTDERAIIDVICPRTNKEIRQIIQLYSKMYNRNLEKDIISEVGGDFEDFLVSLLNCNREEKPSDPQLALTDARELYAGEEGKPMKKALNKEVGIRLLTTRSFDHLREVFQQYKKVARIDIQKAIDTKLKGDLKRGMTTIVQFANDPLAYYAKLINDAIKGLGTNDEVLIRAVLSRCEIDMANIKVKFHDLYERSLDKALMDDTSGDYARVLHQLVHHSHEHIITKPNDLLDASFKDRTKFFREQVKKRHELKSEPGVMWSSLQKFSVEDPNVVVAETESRFFGGTLREKSTKQEPDIGKKHAHTHFGFAEISPLHKDHTENMDKGYRWSLRGGDGRTGNVSQGRLSPRNSLFKHRSAPIKSSNDRKSKVRSKSTLVKRKMTDIDTIKRRSTLTKNVETHLAGRRRIARELLDQEVGESRGENIMAFDTQYLDGDDIEAEYVKKGKRNKTK